MADGLTPGLREFVESLEYRTLIRSACGLLLGGAIEGSVLASDPLSINSVQGRLKLPKLMDLIHALLTLVLAEAQMREFLLCVPVKSTKDQLAFAEVVWSFVPQLESYGIVPAQTVSMKSDLNEVEPSLIFLRYLAEGLLYKENSRRYPDKAIHFCNHTKTIETLFRTPDYCLKIGETFHFWIGAETKSSILLKQRNIDRQELIKCMNAYNDWSTHCELKTLKSLQSASSYKSKMKHAADQYVAQITALRKDIARLEDFYKKLESTAEPRSLLPQTALDRAPKVDR